MRKIIVLTFISLDGVMQAPGGPDEDTTSGFKYGGWTAPYFDDFSGKLMDEQIGEQYELLLGRKTYDIFANYWPKHNEIEIGKAFNKTTKYVVSHQNLKLDWANSKLITGDVVAQLKKLKQEKVPDLQVHGSGNLVQTLLKNDLVDELWLKTFPVTLGSGKKLFAEGTVPGAWKLTRTEHSPSGVIFAYYTRAGEVKTGTF